MIVRVHNVQCDKCHRFYDIVEYGNVFMVKALNSDNRYRFFEKLDDVSCSKCLSTSKIEVDLFDKDLNKVISDFEKIMGVKR